MPFGLPFQNMFEKRKFDKGYTLGQVTFIDFWKFKIGHPDPIVKFYAENEYEIGFFEK